MLDGFDGPFAPVPELIAPPPGQVIGSGRAGWLISHATNNGFILTNRLLKAAGIAPQWLADPVRVGGAAAAPGAVWIPASLQAAGIVARSTRDLGIDAYARATRPAGEAMPLKPVRIGLVDRLWRARCPSGWTRWLLEQFEFPFTPRLSAAAQRGRPETRL